VRSDIPQIYDLFVTERVAPMSPKQMRCLVVGVDYAINKNQDWHSRLPDVAKLTVMQKHHVCYGAEYHDNCYAVAIWSDPVAREYAKLGYMLELRRLAIAPDAPKFTATWMLSKMIKDIKKRFPDITKLVSYQDTEVHTGTIYAAGNWKLDGQRKGSEWACKSRDRPKAQSAATKIRWIYEI